MNRKILLIGNKGLKANINDGQTIKVRLYMKKIQDEGFDIDFIDLENFTKKPIRVLRKIKKAIPLCDRIVLITAERGTKLLVPLINKWNKKYNKPFVLPLVGSGILHYAIDNLGDKEKYDFLVNGKYSFTKPSKKLSKQFKKITYILAETDLLTKVCREFYGLNNVYTLNNFRERSLERMLSKDYSKPLKLCFLSRVMKMKGILDLMKVVHEINSNGQVLSLDIYGKKLLSNDEEAVFNKFLDKKIIRYKGLVEYSQVIPTISKYDLFVFPTRFLYEGVPGVIVESLLAGTPILTSNFPQVYQILVDGKDSMMFSLGSEHDLKDKLEFLAKNTNVLDSLRKEAIKSSGKFVYDFERKKFLNFVCGLDINNKHK